MKIRSLKIVVVFSLIALQTIAQKQANNGWHLLSPIKDSVYGIDLNRAYEFLLQKNKKPTQVIVAVLDSGVDTTHEDLKNILWHNPKEIPNNNIDDDKNGYVDDVYGWNFLGGKDGRSITRASDEKSRVYHKYKEKFSAKNIDTTIMSVEEKYLYKCWKKSADEIVISTEEQTSILYLEVALKSLKKNDKIIREDMQKEEYTLEELEKYTPKTEPAKKAKMAFVGLLKSLNVEADTKNTTLLNEIENYIEGKKTLINAKDNPPYNYRAEFVKDNYDDINDKFYGNKDVMATTPTHGTHVTGIIAAQRDNNIGINGAADNVKVMMLRVVPDGDEYDKDIALAIFYAVNNGAKIINMSFGKSFSPNKKWIDSAVQYAATKDVLFVQAAGNEKRDIDVAESYPTPYFIGKQKRALNYITVGASSDVSLSPSIVADFSNYGKTTVDVFAPGYKIYSTLPSGNQYGNENGTSMASPLVAGVAAMLRSYYPTLSAMQIKDVIEKSVTLIPNNIAVIKPSTTDDVSLKDLCKTGGIVNAFEAVKLADALQPEKMMPIKNTPILKKKKTATIKK